MDYNSKNLDQSLIASYKEAIYQTFKPEMTIKVDQTNEALSVFMFDNNVYSWAYVSACNPFSIKITEEENKKRHQALIDAVKTMNLRYLEGTGKSPDNTWSEPSLLVLDINKKAAIELANTFDQNAILYGRMDGKAELLLVKTQ